ncbi:MAG: sigma-70 family RNA polymerase sigma factor [Aeoliella sp.]
MRAREGSQGALGALLDMQRLYVKLLARMQLGQRLQGRVDPSDLVQATFLRAHGGFGEFRGESEADLMVWLRRILARTLADQLRHHHGAAKRDARREQNLDAALGRSSEQLQLAIVAHGLSPSGHAQRREQAVLVADALEQLPEHYREVIVLRNLRDLSFPEVAQQMGRTVDSVKQMWPRALARLRQQLVEIP